MPEPAGGPSRVLVVDDDRDLLPFLETTLRELSDFEVYVADNGIAGLERFIAVRPHCVVVDVRMPGLDGYQFVRALRGDPDTADAPLVILTAMAQEKDRFAGLAAGADQYLLKPIKPLALLAAIERAIAMGDAARHDAYQDLAEEIL